MQYLRSLFSHSTSDHPNPEPEHANRTWMFEEISPKKRSFRMCMKILESEPKKIAYVPFPLPDYLTPVLVKVEDNTKKMVVYEKADHLTPAEATTLCSKAIESGAKYLEFIPVEFITEELFKQALEKDEMALKFITKENRSSRICKLAVEKNTSSLQYVPEELHDFYFYSQAIASYYDSLTLVFTGLNATRSYPNANDMYFSPNTIPEKYINSLLGFEPLLLYTLPANMQTEKNILAAVKQHLRILNDTSDVRRTKKIERSLYLGQLISSKISTQKVVQWIKKDHRILLCFTLKCREKYYELIFDNHYNLAGKNWITEWSNKLNSRELETGYSSFSFKLSLLIIDCILPGYNMGSLRKIVIMRIAKFLWPTKLAETSSQHDLREAAVADFKLQALGLLQKNKEQISPEQFESTVNSMTDSVTSKILLGS